MNLQRPRLACFSLFLNLNYFEGIIKLFIFYESRKRFYGTIYKKSAAKQYSWVVLFKKRGGGGGLINALSILQSKKGLKGLEKLSKKGARAGRLGPPLPLLP